MRKKRLCLSICLTVALSLWGTFAMATSGNMSIVNNFCGSGTITTCSFCHTPDPGTTQDTYNCGYNSADCSANQVAFLQGQSSGGNYCFFCPSNASCTPAPQCTTNADCDDGLFCNGAETCDAAGNCQPGTAPCATGQACDETNHCMAGPECTTDTDCDDGVFCNGVETCDAQNKCQAGTNPCAAGETCSEANGCTAPSTGGSTDGEALFAENCAACHGADGSGGSSGENIIGESAKEIREAIMEVGAMKSLSFLTFDELQQIASFLGGGQDLDNDEGSMHRDSDGDGISDDHEGFVSSENDSEDSNHDGVPDYKDPKVTHFDADDHSGSMILMTDQGRLEAAATVDEAATLPSDGKPAGIDFKWGFVDFMVTGLTPGTTINITLRMPATLPAGAEYWKYDEKGYHRMNNITIDGRNVTFSLTDDNNDGVIVDPGAVGILADSTGASSGGGGGCSLAGAGHASEGLDPALLIVLLLPLALRLTRAVDKR
jgi:cytochrome c553